MNKKQEFFILLTDRELNKLKNKNLGNKGFNLYDVKFKISVNKKGLVRKVNNIIMLEVI